MSQKTVQKSWAQKRPLWIFTRWTRFLTPMKFCPPSPPSAGACVLQQLWRQKRLGTSSTGPRGVGDEGSLASCPPEASWDGNGTSELDWGHSFPTLDWHFLKGEFEFIQKNMVSWGKIVWRTWSSGWNGLFSHSLGWPSFKSHRLWQRQRPP